ncbi:MAG: hypothetical protein ABIS01_08160 [Ferruginibacter sp.]
MQKKRKPVFIAVLLMLAVVNYTRLTGNENVRAVQFLSIFVIGMLSGLLIRDLITAFRAGSN